jgi:DNA polymerase-1
MSTVSPPSSPTLFLVDGYALIYRAFFALLSRPLRTAKGENTSAAWGVVNFLQRLLETHHPDYVAWIHDAGSSFRQSVFPAYKATREKLTDELQADFTQGLERIAQLLDAFRVRIVTVEGYEADDVIGTLAEQAVARGVNTVVVSGDKDFQQLVRPGIWLLNPGRGGPASVEEQWVGVENASDRLGVAPGLVTDFLALVGDSSDNVPGVPGIGEKTAQELIASYGGLDTIFAHVDHITKKRPREALRQFREQAYLSKELVTIRHDAPIALELEALRVQQPDLARLRQLFVELEFASLLKTLQLKPDTAPAARQRRAYHVVTKSTDVPALVDRLRAAGAFALACAPVAEALGADGADDPLRCHIAGIAIGLERDCYYLPLRHQPWNAAQGSLSLADGSVTTPQGDSLSARLITAGKGSFENLPGLASTEFAPLLRLLEDAGVEKWARNAKFEQLLLRNSGISLRGARFDAMLASYVLDPGRRSHDLPLLAQEFCGRTMQAPEVVFGKGRSAVAYESTPVEVAGDYLCEIVDALLDVRGELGPKLRETGAQGLLDTIELPLVEVLADMEWYGVAIDVAWFRSLKERFQRERERVERAIYTAAGEEFNINSNPQLRQILFEKLQLPVRKKTPTGPSTDASVLQELADEGHEIPALLMEYRELAKLESTYLDTLPQLLLPRDNRLHTNYNQTVAATGRLSSSDPNLQNIPIRRELGRDIRRGFVPRSGSQFLAADYSQIELRLLAHLSQDPAFLAAFQAERDIHRETAAVIFGVPTSDVTPDMRARAKTINFATIYGQGAHALSRQLKITNQEAKAFIATYFERFGGVRRYLDTMVAVAREQGFVETIFHRRRYIPELREKNFNIRAFGERVATNAPIQGSAADLIKLAMIHVHHAIAAQKLESRMILQVHDELVFEGPPAETEVLTKIVRQEMEGAAKLSVPLVVEIGTGANWYDAKG